MNFKNEFEAMFAAVLTAYVVLLCLVHWVEFGL